MNTIPPEVSAYMRELGKKKTPAQIAARKRNMEELNAAYSPEKRKAAAKKRLETMKRKRETAL